MAIMKENIPQDPMKLIGREGKCEVKIMQNIEISVSVNLEESNSHCFSTFLQGYLVIRKKYPRKQIL